ncbi:MULTISPECIES: hypothetical protein [Streptomyces]|nr:hypothetical protein [Streptomyces ruber]
MRIEHETLNEYARAVARREVSALRLTFMVIVGAVVLTAVRTDRDQLALYAAFVWLAVGTLDFGVRERRAARIADLTRIEGRRVGRDPYELVREEVVHRYPDREVYLLLTLAGLSYVGLKSLLSSVHVAGLSPADAPAILTTAVSLPGLIVAVSVMIPRVLRAWGAKEKDAGQGRGAASSGRADIIRAEKEGEAAVLRARAELRRADAEYKRAEMGLAPLPPAQLPPPDEPPELPPASGNGAAAGGTPQPPSL